MQGQGGNGFEEHTTDLPRADCARAQERRLWAYPHSVPRDIRFSCSSLNAVKYATKRRSNSSGLAAFRARRFSRAGFHRKSTGSDDLPSA